jgi:hypothetical protein
MTHNEVLKNRATMPDKEAQAFEGECCTDPLIFAMRDNNHQFSMGLFTILQCLKIAENNGAIPELPPEWWWAVESRYQQHLHLLE